MLVTHLTEKQVQSLPGGAGGTSTQEAAPCTSPHVAHLLLLPTLLQQD